MGALQSWGHYIQLRVVGICCWKGPIFTRSGIDLGQGFANFGRELGHGFAEVWYRNKKQQILSYTKAYLAGIEI